MIIYSDTDWKLLTSIDQVAEGESYFVYDGNDKIHLGVMERIDDELHNETATIDLDGTTNSNYWIMPFDFPPPPIALSSKSKDF